MKKLIRAISFRGTKIDNFDKNTIMRVLGQASVQLFRHVKGMNGCKDLGQIWVAALTTPNTFFASWSIWQLEMCFLAGTTPGEANSHLRKATGDS